MKLEREQRTYLVFDDEDEEEAILDAMEMFLEEAIYDTPRLTTVKELRDAVTAFPDYSPGTTLKDLFDTVDDEHEIWIAFRL